MKTTPCGSSNPGMLCTRWPFSRSTTSRVPLPSAQTNSFRPAESIARWSMRPSTPTIGIVCTRRSGVASPEVLGAVGGAPAPTRQVIVSANSAIARISRGPRRTTDASWVRGSGLGGRGRAGHVERGAEALGQRLGRPDSPVVEEEDPRLLSRHVLVDGDDIDAGVAKGLEQPLKLRLEDREVAVHSRACVRPGERAPRVDS